MKEAVTVCGWNKQHLDHYVVCCLIGPEKEGLFALHWLICNSLGNIKNSKKKETKNCLKTILKHLWSSHFYKVDGCRRFLRYHYNPFDHLHTVHSDVRGFNKNPYKPYIYWKLNTYMYRFWPDQFKTVKSYHVSKMWICLQSFTNT